MTAGKWLNICVIKVAGGKLNYKSLLLHKPPVDNKLFGQFYFKKLQYYFTKLHVKWLYSLREGESH